MKRILVLGRTGAGKTIFSEKLGKKLGRQVVHLDNLFWKPGWVRAFSVYEWEDEIRKLVKKDEWILDGNYHNTLDMRLERADTVIYLDIGPVTSLLRVLKRRFFPPTNSGNRMLELHQKVNILMLIRTAFSFPSKEIYKKIKKYDIENVYVIKNAKQVSAILQTVTAGQGIEEKKESK